MAVLRMLALTLLATLGVAQVHPGQVVPELAVVWAEAAQGGVSGGGAATVQLRGTDAPKVVVVAFYRSAAVARIDLDLLRDLAERHAGDGVRAVVVLPGGALGLGLELPRGVVAAGDAEGAARSEWLGAQHDFYVAVAVAQRIAWVGRPGQGLAAAVAAAVAGELDPAVQGELWRRRQQLLGRYAEAAAAETCALAEELLRQWPSDGPSWALRYLADLGQDPVRARRTAADATAALAADPRALASFAELALRGDRGNRAFGAELAKALRPHAERCAGDLRVQLALLRAFVTARDHREVGRLAQVLARRVEDVGAAALEYVEILTQDEQPEVHRDTGARALRAAERQGVDARSLAAVRYQWQSRCAGDAAGARETAARYLEDADGHTVLNNDAWAFLTELGTLGRFDAFALAIVQRMLEHRAALEAFELDTAALAMFANGRLDDAVDLQLAAVTASGGNPDYRARLDRYRAARADKAAPR